MGSSSSVKTKKKFKKFIIYLAKTFNLPQKCIKNRKDNSPYIISQLLFFLSKIKN